MEATDTRLAREEPAPPEVPRWLRTIGIVLGVALVPPIVLPVIVLMMAFGMLAFLPFLPFLFAEFAYGAGSTTIDEAKEEALKRTSFAPRARVPRAA